MKAIVCKSWGLPDTLVLQDDLPDLIAQAGQVVIDVRVAGVNFPDVLIIQNKYQHKPELPFIPGSELSGIITAVGEDVTKYRIGDRVIAFAAQGAFAQQIVVPVESLMPMPPNMDYDIAAATTLTYGTSHHAIVDRGRLKEGETILVDFGIQCQNISKRFFLDWFKLYKYNSYLLIPRSSISKTPLMMKNSIGLIDAGYTGNIKAPLYNTSSEPFYIKRGERYVQLVNSDLSSIHFKLVNSHRNTTRNTGGFGSTN